MMNKMILLATMVLALTACNRAAEPTAAPIAAEAISTKVAPEPVAQPPIATKQAGFLKLEESVVDLCKHADGLMATQVSWDASSLPTEGVEVWLQGPGEERKLWAATTPKGTERTGAWLRSGSKVILINGADKSVLQEIIVTEQPCANKQ